MIAINADWETKLNDAFLAMDVNGDGTISFDELLKYSKMNRELFQVMIGTGNRNHTGAIADAGAGAGAGATHTPARHSKLARS